MVSERIGTAIPLPSFVDSSDVEDTDALRTEWQRIVSEKPADLISDVLDVEADPNEAYGHVPPWRPPVGCELRTIPLSGSTGQLRKKRS